MANVTISMDGETLRWVRVEAAKAGMSVSRYVGQVLTQQRLGGGRSRAEIMREILDRAAWDVPERKGQPLWPGRDELYRH